MNKAHKGLSRRQFLKSAGMAGAGTLLAGHALAVTSESQPAAPAAPVPQAGEFKVPTRPFGKSGRDVSILGLGGMFDIEANQLMLKQAINWGVTYWDTADCYHAGSEAGIGKFFGRYPQEREKIFLVTKSCERKPEAISQLLERSLSRMQTSYIDLYFLHSVKSLNELNDDVRQWAEKAKADKKIRLFGFSTHTNMAELLMGASKSGWIDGIMLTYNYRNMHAPEMIAAMKACNQAGIGLTAMKTQAKGSWYDWNQNDPAQKVLADQFRKKGWTEEQAKLKAVWQNPQIACLCSQMDSMRLLKANADAAVAPATLSSEEMRLLQEYACATAATYCTGCGKICEATLQASVPISDIMRYHMYSRGYGRPEWARTHFGTLSLAARQELAAANFSAAEAMCPQHMPIGRLMKEALDDFA